ILHRGFRTWAAPRPSVATALGSLPGVVLCWIVTFLSVCLGYIVFRTLSFAGTGAYLWRMVVPTAGEAPPLHPLSVWLTVLGVVICHAAAVTGAWHKWSVRLPAPVLGAAYALVVLVALMIAPADGQAFIYFQF